MDEQAAVLIPDLADFTILENRIGAAHHVIEVPVRGHAMARAIPATDGASRDDAVTAEWVVVGGQRVIGAV